MSCQATTRLKKCRKSARGKLYPGLEVVVANLAPSPAFSPLAPFLGCVVETTRSPDVQVCDLHSLKSIPETLPYSLFASRLFASRHIATFDFHPPRPVGRRIFHRTPQSLPNTKRGGTAVFGFSVSYAGERPGNASLILIQFTETYAPGTESTRWSRLRGRRQKSRR